ncbi:MAG: glycosyltransferase [Bacteroidetes bacterium]|nr:glycosyltransferase [Bacteroidota bacterium]
MPNLSIITINFNNLPGLQTTMQSVFEQTYTDFEYIIIDGGSTDGSKEWIETHRDKLAYCISEKDNGIYHAMNKGIQQAGGKYCMFLNSGDCFVHNNVLQNSFQKINDKQPDICYGDVLFEESNGEKWVQTHAPVLDVAFLQKRTLNHQSSFIKRSLFYELGLYKEQYQLAADYAFYLQAFLKSKNFFYLNEVMVHYKRDGISSRQMENYRQQMQTIWNEMLPAPLTQLLEENKMLKKEGEKRLIKLGKKMDALYRKLRK